MQAFILLGVLSGFIFGLCRRHVESGDVEDFEKATRTAANLPREALHYFEQGCAVSIGQLIDNCRDLLILEHDHPKIAGQYQGLLILCCMGHTSRRSTESLSRNVDIKLTNLTNV